MAHLRFITTFSLNIKNSSIRKLRILLDHTKSTNGMSLNHIKAIDGKPLDHIKTIEPDFGSILKSTITDVASDYSVQFSDQE